MCSDDRNTAASRIRRLTPEERADMVDVLDAGTSLYDSDVRALIDHATAMDDELAALRAESMDLHAQIGEWSAKYALDVDALRAERDAYKQSYDEGKKLYQSMRTERDMMEVGWKAETERHSDTLIEVERMRPVVEAIDACPEDDLPPIVVATFEAYREACK